MSLHPQRAVWNRPDRKFKRHSLERDVQHFCGWKQLLTWIGLTKNDNEKNLIVFAFETGGINWNQDASSSDTNGVAGDIISGAPVQSRLRDAYARLKTSSKKEGSVRDIHSMGMVW